MVINIFLVKNKDKEFRFFEKSFLLANFSMDITL